MAPGRREAVPVQIPHTINTNPAAAQLPRGTSNGSPQRSAIGNSRESVQNFDHFHLLFANEVVCKASQSATERRFLSRKEQAIEAGGTDHYDWSRVRSICASVQPAESAKTSSLGEDRGCPF